MKHTLNGSIENCSDVHSFALPRSWLKFSGTTQSSILRKPLVGTWGYCKPFLCSWCCSVVAVESNSCKFHNGMLGPIMEHPLYMTSVNCFYIRGFVISRSWLKLSETTESSTTRKPFVGTWGYCQPFLCSWCCTIVVVESNFLIFKKGCWDREWKTLYIGLPGIVSMFMRSLCQALG